MKNRLFLLTAIALAGAAIAFMVSCKDKEWRNPNTATVAENVRAKKMYDGYLKKLSTLPVSFHIGDESYQGLGKAFTETDRKKVKDGSKETTTVTLSHSSGVTVTLTASIYREYAAYEWELWFTNNGTKNSPVISNVHIADVVFEGKDPTLIGIMGDVNQPDIDKAFSTGAVEPVNHAPYHTKLPQGVTAFAPYGGRSTDTCFPYYDFQYGDGGCLMAIGWAGQWKSDFTVNGNTTVFRAGQETFSSYLMPGETAKMPFVSFVFYDGRDEERATNLWRRWMIDCNMPRVDGKLLQPMIFAAHPIGGGMMSEPNLSEQLITEHIQWLIDKKLSTELYWMDAGWYTKDVDGASMPDVGAWPATGTWVVDTKRFPTKFKAVSELAATANIRTILWFEPDRVSLDPNTLKTDGSTIKKDWLLYNELFPERWLVNLGIPEAVDWLSEKIIGVMKEGGISIFRHDFNMPPLPSWRNVEAEDRKGMVENLHIQGLFRMWDNITSQIPGSFIDNCASGGRRNDLASLRKTYPLLYSDYFHHDWTVRNGITVRHGVFHSLFKWHPYFVGTGMEEKLRQAGIFYTSFAMMPTLFNFLDVSNEANNAMAYQFIDVFNELKDIFYEDYYPLTGWNVDEDKWIGWQFMSRNAERGFVQMFRREKSEQTEMTVKLRGLNANAMYELTEATGKFTVTCPGADLMRDGYSVRLEPKTTCIIKIKKI